jgi:hypothetical protein
MQGDGEKVWIDVEAALAEELARIQTGAVPDQIRQASIVRSAERAEPDAPPDGKIYDVLHKANLWALCLSGGGIRSATFALGILQGLARADLLARFHYLSTVSGGGYIGSWLTSWATRHEEGFTGVAEALKESAKGQPTEISTVRHLRSFSAYLNPRAGLFSADTWTLIGTYLRNLLLNWLVLIPLLWALLLTPKLGLAFVRLLPGDPVTDWLIARRPGAVWVLFGIGALGLLIGMSYVLSAIAKKLSGHAAQADPVKRNAQARFLIHGLLPIAIAALALPLAWALYSGPPVSVWWLVAAGAILRVIAWALSFGLAKAFGPLDMPEGPWTVIATFLASLVTGALGGFLVWWLATTFFSDIAGMIGVGYDAAHPEHALSIAFYVCVAPPVLLMTMLTTEAIFVGLVSRQTDDEDREWWGRAGAWLLIAGIFWVSLRVLVLFGPMALLWLVPHAPVLISSLGGISGIAAAALGFSGGTPAKASKGAPGGLGGFLKDSLLSVSATVFIVAICAGLALGGDWILHHFARPGEATQLDCALRVETDLMYAWWNNCGIPAAVMTQSVGVCWIIGAIAALLFLAAVMQSFVNVNRFSLHALYRARLIRAYLGASNTDRRPNWFTGFDPADNLRLAEIEPEGTPVAPDKSQSAKPHYPLHVLNTTLNLVGGTRLAWQQRKAEPMSMSALHVGNGDLGYRPAELYGGSKGLSLGTALTISGAAASPNMGYHSSPIIGLLMTFFNVRLGTWLGNPGRNFDRTVDSEGPRLSALYLAFEAMGLTDDQKSFVYLSDGGHFEDMGLYEMVRRRCRLIVVSDAGCDPDFEFEDLGNAIRKIRIDFGIDITMSRINMHPRGDVDSEGQEHVYPGWYCATGDIAYAEGEPGKLIYIKPGLYGHEPVDVRNYAAKHPDFPHESTSDQWFDEPQFESYRRLGLYVAVEAFGKLNPNPTGEEVAKAAGTPPGAQAKQRSRPAAGKMAADLLDAKGEPDLGPTAMPTILHRKPRRGWLVFRR